MWLAHDSSISSYAAIMMLAHGIMVSLPRTMWTFHNRQLGELILTYVASLLRPSFLNLRGRGIHFSRR